MNAIAKMFMSSLILFSLSVHAEQRLDMEGTAIIGNKELPRVLYIVPWKPADVESLPATAYHSVLDADIEPVERKDFKRRLKFYADRYTSGK